MFSFIHNTKPIISKENPSELQENNGSPALNENKFTTDEISQNNLLDISKEIAKAFDKLEEFYDLVTQKALKQKEIAKTIFNGEGEEDEITSSIDSSLDELHKEINKIKVIIPIFASNLKTTMAVMIKHDSNQVIKDKIKTAVSKTRTNILADIAKVQASINIFDIQINQNNFQLNKIKKEMFIDKLHELLDELKEQQTNLDNEVNQLNAETKNFSQEMRERFNKTVKWFSGLVNTINSKIKKRNLDIENISSVISEKKEIAEVDNYFLTEEDNSFWKEAEKSFRGIKTDIKQVQEHIKLVRNYRKTAEVQTRLILNEQQEKGNVLRYLNNRFVKLNSDVSDIKAKKGIADTFEFYEEIGIFNKLEFFEEIKKLCDDTAAWELNICEISKNAESCSEVNSDDFWRQTSLLSENLEQLLKRADKYWCIVGEIEFKTNEENKKKQEEEKRLAQLKKQFEQSKTLLDLQLAELDAVLENIRKSQSMLSNYFSLIETSYKLANDSSYNKNKEFELRKEENKKLNESVANIMNEADKIRNNVANMDNLSIGKQLNIFREKNIQLTSLINQANTCYSFNVPYLRENLEKSVTVTIKNTRDDINFNKELIANTYKEIAAERVSSQSRNKTIKDREAAVKTKTSRRIKFYQKNVIDTFTNLSEQKPFELNIFKYAFYWIFNPKILKNLETEKKQSEIFEAQLMTFFDNLSNFKDPEDLSDYISTLTELIGKIPNISHVIDLNYTNILINLKFELINSTKQFEGIASEAKLEKENLKNFISNKQKLVNDCNESIVIKVCLLPQLNNVYSLMTKKEIKTTIENKETKPEIVSDSMYKNDGFFTSSSTLFNSKKVDEIIATVSNTANDIRTCISKTVNETITDIYTTVSEITTKYTK